MTRFVGICPAHPDDCVALPERASFCAACDRRLVVYEHGWRPEVLRMTRLEQVVVAGCVLFAVWLLAEFYRQIVC